MTRRPALLLCLWLATGASAKNLGHRLGGDIYKPENTLHCYEQALEKLQDHEDFHYVELDIQETADGKIVVFHDTSKITRLVPKTAENLTVLRAALRGKRFEKLRISDLTLAQIRPLRLAKGARIPTLKQVLDASIAWKLRKPMLIEVKSLRTDACRHALLALVAPYRKKLNVNFLAFRGAFCACFPDPLRWKLGLGRHGFKCYTAMKPKRDEFDLARGAPAELAGLRFQTLLKETPFSIVAADGRSVRLPIAVPDRKGRLALRIGIEHGYDDSGDRGVSFRLLGKADEQLAAGFSKSRGWKWFEAPVSASGTLTLVVEDRDTKLTGKYAGNGGRVKATLSYEKR